MATRFSSIVSHVATRRGPIAWVGCWHNPIVLAAILLALVLLSGTAGLVGCRQAAEPNDLKTENTHQPPKITSESPPASKDALTGGESRPQSVDSALLPALPAAEDLRQAEMTALRREAAETAARVAEAFPTSAEALAVRAWMHHRYGQTAEAVRCWQRCLDLDARYAEAHVRLGQVALKTGDFERARTCFDRACQADPQRTDARIRLAEALLHSGEADQAVAVLERSGQAALATAEGLYFLGRARLLLNDHQKAKDAFSAAIGLDPALTHAYHGLATACARLGDNAEADRWRAEFDRRKQQDQEAEKQKLKAFDDLAALRASVAMVHCLAAQVYLHQSQTRPAEDHWRRAASLDERNADARLGLVALCQQEGRAAEAIRPAEELVRIEPRNSVYWLSLGVLNAQLDRLEAAERAFRKAIEVAPGHAQAHAAMAQFYLRAGRDPLQARRCAETAVRLAPTAPNYALLAAACQSAGELEAARKAVGEALRLEPDNPQYRRLQESLRHEK
jgi:tetratricopeptide (TPR) repeat protein